jgi:hypothetical protein
MRSAAAAIISAGRTAVESVTTRTAPGLGGDEDDTPRDDAARDDGGRVDVDRGDDDRDPEEAWAFIPRTVSDPRPLGSRAAGRGIL